MVKFLRAIVQFVWPLQFLLDLVEETKHDSPITPYGEEKVPHGRG
jgi:hypothetical protein